MENNSWLRFLSLSLTGPAPTISLIDKESWKFDPRYVCMRCLVEIIEKNVFFFILSKKWFFKIIFHDFSKVVWKTTRNGLSEFLCCFQSLLKKFEILHEIIIFCGKLLFSHFKENSSHFINSTAHAYGLGILNTFLSTRLTPKLFSGSGRLRGVFLAKRSDLQIA